MSLLSPPTASQNFRNIYYSQVYTELEIEPRASNLSAEPYPQLPQLLFTEYNFR